jgi:hypothetical protein
MKEYHKHRVKGRAEVLNCSVSLGGLFRTFGSPHSLSSVSDGKFHVKENRATFREKLITSIEANLIWLALNEISACSPFIRLR